MSNLEVVRGELQHVPQDVADDLGLPLQDHGLVVQRLYDLRLDLKQTENGVHPDGRFSSRHILLRSFSTFSVTGNPTVHKGISACRYCPFTVSLLHSSGVCWEMLDDRGDG